ncbi:hypothetical protein APHAL10511_001219 [Amanita phalloides]|nr:hypothetical protein APHAL10511_001219 [Amanita phalloides]
MDLCSPTTDLIKKTFDRFTNPQISREKLKNAALADRLYPVVGDGAGVPGRSISWKIFLLLQEPLDSAPVNPSSLLEVLRYSRVQFTDLLLQYMRAPDGSYEEDFRLPGSDSPPKRTTSAFNIETNNPLSLHKENPWRQWFESVELRKIISQDVERTFPEIPYFREAFVQAQLTNILFLYSVITPTIGYRQGMHELLAPLYYAVQRDAVPCNEDEGELTSLQQICSPRWIAADAWALFTTVMKGVSRWYEWHETPDKPLYFTSHIHLDLASGQTQLKPYVAPIVQTCNDIQATLLKAVDPPLCNHMQKLGIEPQIYGIRWLRLLFTREFSMLNAMKLWDGLFASDPTFELVPWICVSMLIRIRSQLLAADYSGQLTLLLHYPSLDAQGPYQILLLIRQAIALQLSPKPSIGATIMMENRTILDIPVEVAQDVPQDRTSHIPRNKSSTSFGTGGRQQPQPSTMHFPELIARGLLERGESLGINKTVMNAVSELRKSMPDLTGPFSRSPPPHAPSYPLTAERSTVERPPWEPRTRFEIEREMSQLRSNNKRLGEALGWVVDVMLQDESGVQDLERLRRRRREALESLAYVRDALMGEVCELEEDRLFGEEELRRKREVETAAAGLRVDVRAPARASVVDSRPRMTVGRGRVAGGRAESGREWAPWNHTESGFSLEGRAEMPRVPPALRRAGAMEDPLGVSRAGPEITGPGH